MYFIDNYLAVKSLILLKSIFLWDRLLNLAIALAIDLRPLNIRIFVGSIRVERLDSKIWWRIS